MTKINYQALRAKAEKATCGVWSLEYGEERFDAGDAYRGKRDLPGVPEKSGYEASIDGLGEGRGMSNKYEDMIKSARMNADCGEHMSPAEVTTLLNVVEAKCAALAAENAALKQSEKEFNNFCRQEYYGWEDNFTETPATDAFLAEVRAQCLNAFIQHHSAELDAHIKNGGEQFDEKSVRIRDIIVSARLFREQIRKGAAL